MRKVLILTLIISIFITGCSMPTFGKKVSSEDAATAADPAPEAVAEAIPESNAMAMPPTPTIMPESVSLTGGQPTGEDTVSLLGGPAVSNTPTLPEPDATAFEVVKQARYSTPRFSFEPAAGWQMDAIDSDTLLIHITGDDGAYTGMANLSPYIYFQYTTDGISDTTRLVDVLDDMRSSFAGAEIDEDAAMPVIDGHRGVGQFIEGENDVADYRAYIVVFPLKDGVLKGVFWGEKSAWRDIAPQLNAVLASLRFPQI